MKPKEYFYSIRNFGREISAGDEINIVGKNKSFYAGIFKDKPVIISRTGSGILEMRIYSIEFCKGDVDKLHYDKSIITKKNPLYEIYDSIIEHNNN